MTHDTHTPASAVAYAGANGEYVIAWRMPDDVEVVVWSGIGLSALAAALGETEVDGLEPRWGSPEAINPYPGILLPLPNGGAPHAD